MSMPPQRSSSGSPLEPAAQGRTAPGFIWPTPPYASYAAAVPQSEPEPCEIEGLNGKAMRARLTLFDPGQELLQVQLPPARTTLPLRMNQFRHLTLLTPLRPVMVGGADRGDWLDFHPAISYQVELNDGSQLSGRTIGHVETPEGLFLFPPTDEQGTVQRLFVAKGMVRRVGFGPSLGEVLVAHQTANPAQIATALAEQQELRAQRLGDVLLNLNVVSREQLEAALATQARMPMMRIGEALMGLGLLSQGQLDQALAEQSTNRTVPLGELLVRSGKIQRTELRTALARKMGYPIVRV
ncbi:MAG: pilus assembly protein PilB, partial [Ideonella sp.]